MRTLGIFQTRRGGASLAALLGVVLGGVDAHGRIELRPGVLDVDVARRKVGLGLHQVALGLVETGQLGIAGPVLVIHQIPLLLGEVPGLEVEFVLLDVLDVVGVGGADFAHHGEPLGRHAVVGHGQVGLIFTHLVVADQSVENGPAGGEAVAERGRVGVIVGRPGIFVVMVAAEIRVVPEIREGGSLGRVGAVGGVHLVLCDLQLIPVPLEVGPVRQGRIEIDLHGGHVLVDAFEIAVEGQIGGQRAVGVTHEHGQRVDRRLVLVVGGDHADIGVVHEDLEVEHIAQRDGARVELVLGILEGDLLEFAVLVGNAAVFDGEQNFVVGVGHGTHEQTAGVGFEVLPVIDVMLGGEPVELAGQTVEEQQIGRNAGAGGETVGPAVLAGLTVIRRVHLMRRPAVGVLHGEVRGDDGGVGAQSLIILGPGGVDGEGGREVIGIVLQRDALGVGEGQALHPLEKIVIFVFLSVGEGVPVRRLGRGRIVVTPAQQKQSGSKRNQFRARSHSFPILFVRLFCVLHRS